jgi:hypothetical protein
MDIKIAFKNNNTISQILRPKATNSTPIYNKSGNYKLTCKTCQHVYVGQTSRNLKQRYQEHIRYIRNNKPQSAFAQHILNNQHEYGTIEEIMKLLKPINHTSMLIPYELFFIQSHHQHGQLISEQNPGKLNPHLQLGLDTIQTHVTTWSIITGTIPKPVPTQTWLRPVTTCNMYTRYYIYIILESFNEIHCISFIENYNFYWS